jgi:thymidylate synthase (FAD)
VKFVKPEVFLVARPAVDTLQLEEYLTAVGAPDWVEKHSDVRSFPSDGEILTEVGGRLCYRSWEPGLNANVTKIRENSEEYLGNILKAGHGSVLEHANYSFILHNVSRVLTHEFVRHRAGVAVSQESMRYVRLTDLPFWFPDWATMDELLMHKATRLLEELEAFQGFMTDHFGLDDPNVPFSEKKHKTSFMRRFSPQGVATGMLVTINIRALRHIIYMRTALGAEEEIRIVCDEIAEICLVEFPNLMQDYSPNEHREWIPEFLKV